MIFLAILLALVAAFAILPGAWLWNLFLGLFHLSTFLAVLAVVAAFG